MPETQVRRRVSPLRNWVLLTGATGFVGSALLCELLARGHRVMAVVRAAAPHEARGRLAEAVRFWGHDPETHFEHARLASLRGDLHAPGLDVPQTVLDGLHGRVSAFVHAAGTTRFASTPSGEPARTNIDGTRNAFELASALDCHDWHFVSTAFVCGRATQAGEERAEEPPSFRNAYEQSKWIAEADAAAAAARARASLTIYRPSIVVGDSAAGRTRQFTGIYYLFRAISLLARMVAADAPDRHAVPLRIPADAQGRPNLIGVDDVARTFADIFEAQHARGGVYHLTHPRPPSNVQIRRVLESYYGISGGRFVQPDHAARGDSTPELHAMQRAFDAVAGPVADYLNEPPEFARNRVARFESRSPAAWTDRRIAKLLEYAEAVNWRSSGACSDRASADGIAEYFTRFLPRHLPIAGVARMRDVHLDVQFLIGDALEGHWWCRFRDGQVDVRGPGVAPADVIYSTRPDRFWAAVAGEISGADFFLAGNARIDGDLERGLKFAMILEEFVREFPCRRDEWLRQQLLPATPSPVCGPTVGIPETCTPIALPQSPADRTDASERPGR